MSFETALAAWRACVPEDKCALTHAIDAAAFSHHNLAEMLPLSPGLPMHLQLISPREVPQRSLASADGRATLLHAIAHIEFNAINLALDAALRFHDLPQDYYRDWIGVAQEEAHHFSLIAAHLRETYATRYGDYAAHNGLWDIAARTADDALARMALVPRVMEARGLDVTPGLAEKLRQAGDLRAADILGIILRDEIGHVAIGNKWYLYLCERAGAEPISTFDALRTRYRAPALRPPFNIDARLRAGFTEKEMKSWS